MTTRAEQIVKLLLDSGREDLDELDRAIQAKQAEIDKATASLKNDLAAMQKARGILAARLGLGKPRGGAAARAKREAAVASGSGGGDGEARGRELVSLRRRRVAQFLARPGMAPATPSRIAQACNIPVSCTQHLLKHPWFASSDQGHHLTPLGNREGRDD